VIRIADSVRVLYNDSILVPSVTTPCFTLLRVSSGNCTNWDESLIFVGVGKSLVVVGAMPTKNKQTNKKVCRK